MKRFKPDSSVFNAVRGDERKSFQSTRVYLDDEAKHMPSHIAYKDYVIEFITILNIDQLRQPRAGR